MQNNFSKLTTSVVVLILLFLNIKIKSQAADVVLMLDNSGSIDNAEWTSMSASANSIIDNILSCNVNNRIAVVHFSGLNTNTFTFPESGIRSNLFVESDFTNNATIAKTFTRRGCDTSKGETCTNATAMGAGTYMHESAGVLKTILDNTAVPSYGTIVSTQKTINRNSSNNLIIIYFTDAPATFGNSESFPDRGLVNSLTNSYSGLFPFYNQLKMNPNTSIVVVRVPGATDGTSTETTAVQVAAAVASVGGSYNGTVYANSADPQGNGTKPRKFIPTTNFAITAAELNSVQNQVCSTCAAGTTPPVIGSPTGS
jgi:hypothetical protein